MTSGRELRHLLTVKCRCHRRHACATWRQLPRHEKVIVLDGKKEKVTYELKIKADKKTLEVVLDEAGMLIGE